MRLLNKLYAWMFGYFWLPCPVCKENFGGHESGYAAIVAEDGRGYVVCSKPACNAHAATMNMHNLQVALIAECVCEHAWFKP